MKKTAAPRRPADSAVTTSHIVLPSDTNALGTVFGGTVVSWIDIAAAIAARRHSRQSVVTASFDAIHFVAPARLGHIVTLKATVNFVARTSMEVGVRVESEDPKTGATRHTASAFATFVAIGRNGRPVPVPPVVPESAEEKRRFAAAARRRETRIRLAIASRRI